MLALKVHQMFIKNNKWRSKTNFSDLHFVLTNEIGFKIQDMFLYSCCHFCCRNVFSRFEMRFLIRIKMQVVNDAVFGSIFMTFLKGFQCTKKSTTHRAVFTPFLQLLMFFFMKNSKKWFALRAWKKVHAQNYE